MPKRPLYLAKQEGTVLDLSAPSKEDFIRSMRKRLDEVRRSYAQKLAEKDIEGAKRAERVIAQIKDTIATEEERIAHQKALRDKRYNPLFADKFNKSR